jgi:hypothetical protein
MSTRRTVGETRRSRGQEGDGEHSPTVGDGREATPSATPRRFHLNRDYDTGTVAVGICFEDGLCVMRWSGPVSSLAVFESPEDLLSVYGHDGTTQIDWVDP